MLAVPIEGRLTADPELRFTAGGKAVLTFTLVTSDRRKNKSTDQWENVDDTFFRVTVWEKYAENCAESLEKGDNVIVIGKIKQRKYTTRDNEERTAYQEVTADEVAITLRWRTVPHGVGKAQRGSTTKAADTPPPNDDPWGGTPDEPPY